MAWCTNCAALKGGFEFLYAQAVALPGAGQFREFTGSMMVDKTKLFEEIRSMLVKLFELNPEDIRPDSRLNEDLDLDSIDAVT